MNARKRLLSWPNFILAVTLTVLALQLPRALKGSADDFAVYYKVSERIRAPDWDNIYSFDDGAFPFRYAPLLLPAFEPITRLGSISTARAVWFLAMWLCIVATVFSLKRLLKALGVRHASWITSISLLLCTRYLLDSLICGQPSSLLMLMTILGTSAWVGGKTARAALALWIPAMFKVLPGIQIAALFFSSLRFAHLMRMTLASVALLLSLYTLLVAFVLNASESLRLAVIKTNEQFIRWTMIGTNDDLYFDSATSRSQSFRSVLLREFDHARWVEPTWKAALILASIVFVVQILRAKPLTSRQKLTVTSLSGSFVVLWMPQSLPYQFVFLMPAIVSLIVDVFEKPTKARIALTALFTIICSMGGSSVLGFELSEQINQLSIPVLLCVALYVRESLKLSDEPQADSTLQPSAR